MWKIAIPVVFVIGLLIYGYVYTMKSASYWVWYEGKVEGTITEMVKPECLMTKD